MDFGFCFDSTQGKFHLQTPTMFQWKIQFRSIEFGACGNENLIKINVALLPTLPCIVWIFGLKSDGIAKPDCRVISILKKKMENRSKKSFCRNKTYSSWVEMKN